MTDSGSEMPGIGLTQPVSLASLDALLVVLVGHTWLGMPAGVVEEICSGAPLTPVPRVPEHIPGLINLRGYAVPLLNLQRFLALSGEGTSGREAASFPRIVIVFADRMRVGLLCDRVRGVVQVDRDRQQPISVTQGERLREFARAEIDHPDGLITVLDIHRVLDGARVKK